jgi:hypothetical protein
MVHGIKHAGPVKDRNYDATQKWRFYFTEHIAFKSSCLLGPDMPEIRPILRAGRIISPSCSRVISQRHACPTSTSKLLDFKHDFTAGSRCRSVALHDISDASHRDQTYSVPLGMHLRLGEGLIWIWHLRKESPGHSGAPQSKIRPFRDDHGRLCGWADGHTSQTKLAEPRHDAERK